MVKSQTWIVAGLLLANLLAACTPEADDSVDQEREKPVTSETVWQEDLAEFEQWQLMPGTSQQMETTQRHGYSATVRINDIAARAIEREAELIPAGGVVIKENYTEAGELKDYVVMRKTDAGWYWAEYSPGGRALTSGRQLQQCLQCHSMSGNDYLFTWTKPIPGEQP